VKVSSDGVPFLLHDATLQRTTPERGVASQRPWSELSRIDAGAWTNRLFAGETIPSLEAVAAYCLRNGHALNIEIKPTPGDETRTGQVVAQEAARLWRDATVAPLLSSFRTEALAAAQAAVPALPRALLLDGWRAGWLDEARSLGCVAIVADYSILDGDAVARIHAAGMRALSYTVNDPFTARWLLDCGIDGLITDAVDRFSPVDRVVA
jgi:glycerophosphoryl diester phosphodiesterase